MKIVSTCKSCKSETKIKTLATTRPDLIKDKGESIKVNCTNCGTNQSHHVNDLKAVPNPLYIVVGIVLSLLVTVLLWNILGAVGTISILIPLLLWRQQTSEASGFNNYRTKR